MCHPSHGASTSNFYFTEERVRRNAYRRPTIDATNWRAEQAIRPAVVNRKVWGGNRTQAGAEAQGVLTSVLRTAAHQAKQALDFLSATLRAPLGHAPRLIVPAPT